MVEIPNDMDRMVLYGVNHAIKNGMCISIDFDSSNPDGIQNDAMNIPTMSIKTHQEPIEARCNSGKSQNKNEKFEEKKKKSKKWW